MNDERKPSLAVVSVSVTGTTQPDDWYRMIENQFLGCEGHFVKLADGVFLVKQDECYPAIIKVIDYCNQSRNVPGQPTARLMISELSDSPTILSPEHQDAQALAQETGRQVRLTKFPPPAQPVPNRPV